jgi:lia operon protein LiaF
LLNRLRSDGISWIILIGTLLILLEVSFYDGGVLVFLFLAAFAIYFGRKNIHKKSGKILFWFGVISLGINIFNTVAFKFLLFAILIFIIMRFADSKKHPKYIAPSIKETFTQSQEPLIMKKSALQNEWFGTKRTPEDVFEWNDINIQGIIGDSVIDIGNTVLPKGTSVVSIRNILGNVEILVPYDVEVSIHHSVLAGSIEIFESVEPKAINQSLYYQTPGYETAVQRVKIVTSLWIGDLEVKRI